MPAYDWKPFLEQWSRELIAADQADLRRLPAEVVASGWLGYPGATEGQIVALEARLKMVLPPSYRQFLAVTNGWRSDDFGLDLVLSGTEQVDWFRTLNPTWLAQLEHSEAYMNRLTGGYRHPGNYMPDVLDAFQIAPQIGAGQQKRVYLFDPREVTEGEWQAWTINAMQTAVQQALRPETLELYDSFWALMQALYERFHNESALITHSKAWQSPAGFVPVQYGWRPFLEQYSHDLLAYEQPAGGGEWPDEVIASGWAGYASATEDQIAALEARIGALLPPSYRQFLAVTNGWRDTGAFIYKMWSAEEIDWFRVRNKEWIDIWNSMGGDEFDPDHERRHMKTALEISDIGDSAVMLLNPQVITAEGEWEAWFFSNWHPGARRYRSFWDLMHAQYETMTSLIAHDDKRLSAKADLMQLPAKLPGLVAELHEKAAVWASLASGPMSQHNDAQAQTLNAMADEVQALIDAPRAPAEMLAVLRAIAERAERERVGAEASGQAHIESALGDLSSRKTDPAQIMSRLVELTGQVNFGEAAEGMAAKGRAQGLGSAAAIVRWFINDYPA
ncbi:MAG: SMI1/KNR4 family protein [Aggregatilineales bacterium]